MKRVREELPPPPPCYLLQLPTCLVQTVVSPLILRKLDALAKATGRTRAGYLRHLIWLHVNALSPKLAKTLFLPRKITKGSREQS